MTDPTPNDLPVPTPLSPAAQALITAFLDTPLRSFVCSVHRRDQIAAVLGALADQVVPEEAEPSDQPFADPNDQWPIWHANKKTRRKLLAIATELKALPND